jgi:hypothetical protein
VSGLPAGKTPAVELDGVKLPSAALGLPRRVDPGNHRVVGKAPGFAAPPLEFTIAERGERAVTLAFAPDARPVLAPKPGPVLTSSAAPRRTDGPPVPSRFASPLFLTGVSLAGAGVVAGAVTGTLSLAAADKVKAECHGLVCPNESMRSTADRSLLFAHVSTGSFALAGVGAVLAVVAVAVPAPAPNSQSSRLEPLVGPGTIGIRGVF